MNNKNDGVLKNSFYSVVQIVLTSLCLLIIYFIIIRKLGKAELGAWSIITSLPAAISVFGSGVSGCILRYIPIYTVKKDKIAFNEIIFCGLFFNFLLGGLLVFLGCIFSYPIVDFLFSKHNLPYYYIVVFRLALIMLFLNFLSSVLMSVIDGLQLIHIRNKITIAGSIVFAISLSIFIQFWGLRGVLFAQLIQSTVVLILVCFITFKSELFSFRFFKANRSYFKLFLTYGQGFQVISISILLFEPITKYFLNKYFSLSIVGIYDLVNRIVIQLRILIVGAVQAIVPMVSKSNEQGTLNIVDVYHKTSRGASLLSYGLYSTLMAFGMFAASFLDPEHITIYMFMTLFMIVASHFNVITSTAYAILIGLGELRDVIISHLLSTSINIALFLVLKNILSDRLIVLPVSMSIILSSLYLLYAFGKRRLTTSRSLIDADHYITSLAILTVILSGGVVFFDLSKWYLLAIIVIHSFTMLYFMYKNDFFQLLFRKILNLNK